MGNVNAFEVSVSDEVSRMNFNTSDYTWTKLSAINGKIEFAFCVVFKSKDAISGESFMVEF